ncbi:MAG: 6-carboxytetrahydropterin synthase [Planctomycetes bacterium]|nr:6-carboxytetrahydropterin synthase [Planctomycetota bacterium]
MKTTWSIQIHKDYLKFSAAHFLIFPDGSAERLHGHNYKVFVDVETELDPHGLVINFKDIKPIVREIVDELDERVLIPGQHPVLGCEARSDGHTEIRYRERRYQIPTDEVCVLPISNSSAENLAGYVARELMRRMRERLDGIKPRAVQVGVEETPGQRGVVRFDL